MKLYAIEFTVTAKDKVYARDDEEAIRHAWNKYKNGMVNFTDDKTVKADISVHTTAEPVNLSALDSDKFYTDYIRDNVVFESLSFAALKCITAHLNEIKTIALCGPSNDEWLDAEIAVRKTIRKYLGEKEANF